MGKKQVTVNVMTETDDVFNLLASLVAAIKAKKSAVEIAASELPLLIKAMDGMNEIPAELKDEDFDNTVALGLVKVEKAFRA